MNAEQHFDSIANEYDAIKKKNWYYGHTIHKIVQEELHKPSTQEILDVGCGTGDLLASLQPAKGVGIDVSHRMIVNANRKHPFLSFYHATAVQHALTKQQYDTIVCVDVIEHMTRVQQELCAMKKLLKPHGRLIILMANPLWEPLLMVAERMNLKMKEGPHHRISNAELRTTLLGAGFTTIRQDWFLAFPLHVPFLSAFINNTIRSIPFIKRMGLIEVFVSGVRRSE